jgi:hypothetical protein
VSPCYASRSKCGEREWAKRRKRKQKNSRLGKSSEEKGQISYRPERKRRIFGEGLRVNPQYKEG